MKKLDVKELRNKTVAELRSDLLSQVKDLFRLRVQKTTGEPPKAHVFKSLRRDIARVKTIINEKERNG